MTHINKKIFGSLYWANEITNSPHPLEVGKKISTSLKLMLKLCQEAIEDHYMLPISQQPYNEEEAGLIVENWFNEHIK